MAKRHSVTSDDSGKYYRKRQDGTFEEVVILTPSQYNDINTEITDLNNKIDILNSDVPDYTNRREVINNEELVSASNVVTNTWATLWPNYTISTNGFLSLQIDQNPTAPDTRFGITLYINGSLVFNQVIGSVGQHIRLQLPLYRVFPGDVVSLQYFTGILNAALRGTRVVYGVRIL